MAAQTHTNGSAIATTPHERFAEESIRLLRFWFNRNVEHKFALLHSYDSIFAKPDVIAPRRPDSPQQQLRCALTGMLALTTAGAGVQHAPADCEGLSAPNIGIEPSE